MTNQQRSLEDKFKLHDRDTGSVEIQVVSITGQIEQLTGHTKSNPKDHSSKRGLMKLVNRRRRFLDYIKKHKEAVYKDLVQSLGLRK